MFVIEMHLCNEINVPCYVIQKIRQGWNKCFSIVYIVLLFFFFAHFSCFFFCNLWLNVLAPCNNYRCPCCNSYYVQSLIFRSSMLQFLCLDQIFFSLPHKLFIQQLCVHNIPCLIHWSQGFHRGDQIVVITKQAYEKDRYFHLILYWCFNGFQLVEMNFHYVSETH